MNAEHGTFTPLVFSVTGGEGTESSTFHRHLASKIAPKKTRDMKTLSILSGPNYYF